MSQFLILLHEDEASDASRTPHEIQSLLEDRAAFEQTLRATSTYRDGERLRPSVEGRRVSRTEVAPGPFGDKALGAYYVVEAPSLEAAAELARQCPMAPGAEVDVRPVHSGSLVAGKADTQGRVFAFAVLGSAPNEAAWVDVMDCIDDSTRDHFPTDRFLGGVRLAPHRRGVASTGGRRAVFDGPFLESKEVIGGLFFLRMSSLDDATRWARETGFVEHGTLEIRELWRS